jgi:hypothetical protein
MGLTERQKRRLRKLNKIYRVRRKEKIFKRYGWEKCACCGERDIRFLTIDHVRNDGGRCRKLGIHRAGSNLFSWMKKNGWPRGRFRALCWNCNAGRYYNGGVCPHKDKGAQR